MSDMAQFQQWPGFPTGPPAPPPPPPPYGGPPTPRKQRRIPIVVLAICLPILALTTLGASIGYVTRDDDVRDLRRELASARTDVDTQKEEAERLRSSLTSTQDENKRLTDLNKALSAPSISVRSWIQKEDAQGRAVNIWQPGTSPPTKADLQNSAVYILALITNTGGRAVDLTWYTIESRRGFSMPRAYSDGPKSFYKRVPLRIEPNSQVTVGIDLVTAAVYARRDEARYASRLVMLTQFAGLSDYRSEVPFDFNQMPDNWQ